MKKLRFRVAYALDRMKSQCWVDLVLWALDGIRKKGLPITSAKSCEADASRCGACYCGKFRTLDHFTVNDPAVPAWRVVSKHSGSSES